MKPIKLIPVFKDYIWGGDRLKNEYNKQTNIEPLAESWELSCHENGLSRLYDTPEQSLHDYINENGKEILGTNCNKFEQFPVLLKLIDAKHNLSVQVHPDDEYALEHENQYGKTEAWYILSTDKDAKIIYGLKKDISSEELKRHIKNNTIMDIVNQVNVKAGELYFIEPGTIHAIGEGLVIAEIQQNSNVTYRVYDYDRRDKDGNPRPLHIDKACDVIKNNGNKTDLKNSISTYYGHAATQLVDCSYFKFDKLSITSSAEIKIRKDSFTALMFIEGSGKIISSGSTDTFNKGDCFFCPAGDYSFNIVGACTVLAVRV